MSRAPMQVLILPFRLESAGVRFCVLRRSDDGRWQGLAGGGQDGESPEQAARREAWEEIGLPPSAPLYRLQSMDTVPAADFHARTLWPADLYAAVGDHPAHPARATPFVAQQPYLAGQLAGGVLGGGRRLGEAVLPAGRRG